MAKRAQQEYVGHYNKHARKKSFAVNGQLLVLRPSSTVALRAQWIGPCVIEEVGVANAYWVRFADGGRCHEIEYPPRQDNPLKQLSKGGILLGRMECNPSSPFTRGDIFRTSEKYPPYIIMVLRGGILSAWSELGLSL